VGGLIHWLMVDVIGEILNWLHLYGLADWLGSSGVLHILTIIVVGLIILVVGMLVSITLIWQDRKMLGRFMDRVGTQVGPFGLFQNFADALKVLVKEYIIPDAADRLIYPLAPILIIGLSMAMFVTIPYSQGFYMSNSDLSVILTLAILAVVPFAVLMGGWASNNKYTLIGGMRAAAQTCAYEVPLLLSVASVVVLTGSMNFMDIVAFQYENTWLVIPLIIGFIVFLVSIIAEVERVPFDLPEAEAELVEGWQTEYGGMRFGLIMMSQYARSFVGASLIVLLFFGGWHGPFADYIPAGIWFVVKVFLVFILFVWAWAAFPRIRTDQILDLCWKRLLPLAAINLFIAVFFKTMGWF